ncbi:peptidoglycan/LPS O-acetylase OafA/YrhL [Murinocardiopsis flavida]|uniref:Peptidoglycan/LPS O-acetylase OafA/YrhL n=1 Tax=Murinocardiopsis flavida TaxID=645275 RepID=A0A2P8DIW1_9ACTN|nr:acyltransferase [Murinocardiopsis flavida]PSK97166.1 peptidoglycan/LPS O-acetylase OafA/YrhL [Murinocardiopsis flavida]
MTPPAPPPDPTPPADPARTLPQVSGHQQALDGIRALAALMVLVFHVAIETGAALADGAIGALLSRGEMGVPLFFALSGLLLYRPWARAAIDGTPGPSVRSYLWRRGLRVLPAYWLVALTAMLLWNDGFGIRHWIEVFTLTYTFNTDPWFAGTGPYGLGQMWSLSVEVSFYAALPLIAWLLTRFAARAGGGADARARRLLTGTALIAAAGAAALLLQFYPDPRPYMHAWLPRTLGMFAVGMAIAVLTEWAHREPGADGPARRLSRTLAQSPGLSWGLAAVVYVVASTPVTGPRFVGVDGYWIALADAATSLLFAFFVIAPVAFLPPPDQAPAVRRPAAERLADGTWLAALLAHPVSRFLGRISYGIFLWQFVVLYLWRGFTGQEIFTGSFWFDIGPVTAGTVVLATLTHRFVEEPVRRWARAVPRTPRKPAPRRPA